MPELNPLEALAPSNLPDHLRAHLGSADAASHRNIDKALSSPAKAAQLMKSQQGLADLLSSPAPYMNRVVRLRYLASETSDAFTGVSACAAKCSHCCHIDVHVPKVEAKLIAKATGHKLKRDLDAKPMLEWGERPSFRGIPCTFLKDGMCSIYAHRPLVCRTLINMDDVNVLCELVPDVAVPVPYLNTMKLQETFSLLTQNEPVADIREWFPEV